MIMNVVLFVMLIYPKVLTNEGEHFSLTFFVYHYLVVHFTALYLWYFNLSFLHVLIGQDLALHFDKNVLNIVVNRP